jgi:hypothetical protein
MMTLVQHATEPHHALQREQKNRLTPRNAPYEFSDEKRTFHYVVPPEVKSRKCYAIAMKTPFLENLPTLAEDVKVGLPAKGWRTWKVGALSRFRQRLASG